MKKRYNLLLMFLGFLIVFGGLVLGSWIYQYNVYLSYVSLPIGGLGFMLFLINGLKLWD